MSFLVGLMILLILVIIVTVIVVLIVLLPRQHKDDTVIKIDDGLVKTPTTKVGTNQQPIPNQKTIMVNHAWSNSGKHKNTPTPDMNTTPFIIMLDGDVDAKTVQQYSKCTTIGYLSVGTREDWRADTKDWPAQTVGPSDKGWEGENWLVLDQWQLIKPIMTKRLTNLKTKGFQVFEADNISVIDQFSNPTAAQISTNVEYAKWLAGEAHRIGLKCAFKNGPRLIKSIVNDYDMLITESALLYADDVTQYKLFYDNHKMIFDFEYDASKMKPQSQIDRTVFTTIQLDDAIKGWTNV